MKPGPKTLSDDERFQRVLSRLDVGLCWEWTGATAKGYGKVWNGAGYSLVHRYVWESLVGPLSGPLDHLCRNILCCNPDHLEPVAHRVNVTRGMSPNAIRSRKSTCKHGHSLDDAWIAKNGTRKCRTCNRVRAAARRSAIRHNTSL